jgi:hypothetical protein
MKLRCYTNSATWSSGVGKREILNGVDTLVNMETSFCAYLNLQGSAYIELGNGRKIYFLHPENAEYVFVGGYGADYWDIRHIQLHLPEEEPLPAPEQIIEEMDRENTRLREEIKNLEVENSRMTVKLERIEEARNGVTMVESEGHLSVS